MTSEKSTSRRVRAFIEKLIHGITLIPLVVSSIIIVALGILLIVTLLVSLYVYRGFIVTGEAALSWYNLLDYLNRGIVIKGFETLQLHVISLIASSVLYITSGLISLLLISKKTELAFKLIPGILLSIPLVMSAIYVDLHNLRTILEVINASINGNRFIRTSAGTVIVHPTVVDYTWILKFWSNIWVMILLSLVSIILFLAIAAVRLEKGVSLGRIGGVVSKTIPIVLVVFILVYNVYPGSTGVFAEYSLSTTLAYKYTTIRYKYVYQQQCNFTGISRTAITYTDFETIPVLGWINPGNSGILNTVGGHKSSALNLTRGSSAGIATLSVYYYNYSMEANNITSAWISVKLFDGTYDAYKGIVLIDSGLTRVYEISIYGSSLQLWRYVGGWRRLSSAAIGGYSSSVWYTLVVFFNYTTARTTINAYLYNEAGNLVTSLAHNDTDTNRFRPVYVGLSVGDSPGMYAIFGDFIFSPGDPRYALFYNLEPGMSINIYDDRGSLTYSFTTTTYTYNLSVIRDIVLGRGYTNGSFQAYSPGLLTNCSYNLNNVFLGGDSWYLVYFYKTTLLDSNTSAVVNSWISGNSSIPANAPIVKLVAEEDYYVKLKLVNSNTTVGFYINISIGAQPDIWIFNGIPITSETGWRYMPAGMEVNITLINTYSTATGISSTLLLEVHACRGGVEQGACITLPLTINLRH